MHTIDETTYVMAEPSFNIDVLFGIGFAVVVGLFIFAVILGKLSEEFSFGRKPSPMGVY